MSVTFAARASRRTARAGSRLPRALPVLWHLKASNYNEKVRWALDYKGVPHVRRAAVPGRHRAVAQRLWGGSTLPAVVLDGEAIGDSTQILAALERRYPDPPLYPADCADRRRALELEEFFDEELGPYVRLLFVHHALAHPTLMLGTFVPEFRGPRLATARLMFPVVRRRIRRDFNLDHKAVRHAYKMLAGAGERFRAELQPSGYLVGRDFTVADLTLAAMVSPLVTPAEFPYPQPGRGHRGLTAVQEVLAREGLLYWTRDMYARHRGSSAELCATRAAIPPSVRRTSRGGRPR